MKKITTLVVLGLLFFTLDLNAQHSVKSEDVRNKEQIKELEDLIQRSQDPKEKAKAEAMLSELIAKNKAERQLSPAEEQKLMSETLSPAEYDAWKASKNTKKIITKPEEE